MQRRASQTLEWAQQAGLDILSAALNHLSLGRVYLAEAVSTPTSPALRSPASLRQARQHLNRAVEGLRQAGTQHHIPRGLLARAELFQVTDDLARAQADIEEAMAIASRGGMRLHEADGHLAYARLYLAAAQAEEDLWGFENPKGLAQAHLATAKQMIADMGYHRRDPEVQELALALLDA